MASDLEQAKRGLREQMRARRAGLDPERRRALSAAACARLEALPAWRAAGVVGGYCAIGGELDPADVLAAARIQGKIVVLPRVTSLRPRLRFHRVDTVAALRPGAFGIAEPDAGALAVPAADVNLFLVPGLAFDRAGARLGFGGGYYDELIADLDLGNAARSSVFVGVAYAFQVLPGIAPGPGDRRVDLVVTDEEVIGAKGSQPGPEPDRGT